MRLGIKCSCPESQSGDPDNAGTLKLHAPLRTRMSGWSRWARVPTTTVAGPGALRDRANSPSLPTFLPLASRSQARGDCKEKSKKEKGRKEDLSLSGYETLTMQTPISALLISLLDFPRISISRL